MFASVGCLLLLSLSSVLTANTTCPAWYYHRLSPEYCECGANLFCIDQGLVEIEQGYCATSAGNEDHYYIGMCLFRHAVNNTNRLFSEMPGDPDMLDDVMCGPYNRKGLLCGECFDGFGPAIYSLDLQCANCSYLSTTFAVFSYMLLEFVPITMIFILVILFRFDITSGPLLGYITFCQIFVFVAEGYIVTSDIASNVSLSYQILFKICLNLCRFWTMHFFFKGIIPPFCLSQYLKGIHVQLLRFVPMTFLILLVVFTCIVVELNSRKGRFRRLCKPFSTILNKRNLTTVTTDAVFHAFASFVFLLHGSVFFVAAGLMVAIPAHNYNGSVYKNTLAFDPTIEWLSREHIAYSVIAGVPFTFLTLIPSVLMLIYPTRFYRYLSQYISARKRPAITAFVEAIHSCFKDGLNGTRDYRALAGLMPFLVIPFSTVAMIIRAIGYFQNLAIAFLLGVSSFTVLCLRPFKSTISNVSLAFHFLISTILAIVIYLWNNETDVYTETLGVTIIILPVIVHFLLFMWIGYRIVRYIKTNINRSRFEWRVALTNIESCARKWLCKRRYHGYQELC